MSNKLLKIIPTEPHDKEQSKGAPWSELEREDFHVAVYRDLYPVTPGHLLFVPKFNNIDILKCALEDAIVQGEKMLLSGEIDGFNIGINIGEAAGQTCSWPHVHFIPRRKGDMADPRGGVRYVIPERGNYKLWPRVTD
jgi:diadenosine tetraphosphate (Ap4A) HIT family hydrolase